MANIDLRPNREPMDITLPLDQMTVRERLQTLEALWGDLCRNADAVPSPAWHEKVLADRERRRRDGKESVLDCRRAPAWTRERLA
jgi:hypothetical protein